MCVCMYYISNFCYCTMSYKCNFAFVLYSNTCLKVENCNDLTSYSTSPGTECMFLEECLQNDYATFDILNTLLDISMFLLKVWVEKEE